MIVNETYRQTTNAETYDKKLTEDVIRKRTKRLVGPYLFALAEDLVSW